MFLSLSPAFSYVAVGKPLKDLVQLQPEKSCVSALYNCTRILEVMATFRNSTMQFYIRLSSTQKIDLRGNFKFII